MSNKDLARPFKLAAQLLELHEENPFKARSFQNAAFKLERFPTPVEAMSPEEINGIDGIGKSTQVKIAEVLQRQSFSELDELLSKTPAGVIDMLGVKGLGPKKVHLLWKELGIESTGELLYACNENRLVELKGFGTKTQDQIRHSIEYANANKGKLHYATAETIALQILHDVKESGTVNEISFTGDLRRKCEIITKLEMLVSTSNANALLSFLSDHPLADKNSVLRNGEKITVQLAGQILLEIHLADSIENFNDLLFITTGNEKHLEILEERFQFTPSKTSGKSETEIYHSLKLPFFEPELREGILEFDLLHNGKLPQLLELKDLKGILHNHSTYSDGAHTLAQMAERCKELGYEYFGICDHSKTAFYANGLQEERIIQQHKEIDELNKRLSPFIIFKGIESDILNDGSLDYPDEILLTFDFIVASVHSVLRMDIERATQRLIKAIENPYTTILGHPTGRLLLAREGYPIHHEKIIDACAANNVVIELNANPYRLDLDWRFLQYAVKKNVRISINPDAHRMEGFHDMYYGVCAARKGGLTKTSTFNSLPGSEMKAYFQNRKK